MDVPSNAQFSLSLSTFNYFYSIRKSRSEQPSPSDLGGILDVPSKPGKAIVTLTNLQVNIFI